MIDPTLHDDPVAAATTLTLSAEAARARRALAIDLIWVVETVA